MVSGIIALCLEQRAEFDDISRHLDNLIVKILWLLEDCANQSSLCPISLMDRACGYGPQYERPIRSWGTKGLSKQDL